MSNRETGIWDEKDLRKGHKHDQKLKVMLAEMFSPKAMADLGCGDGWYCRYFKEDCGWPVVHGYEGNVPDYAVYDDIMVLDLSKIRYVDIAYDLVTCLEVGEHIPKRHEQKFLDNMARFASKDLVLSWAVPGQGGRGHYNEQPNDYIIGEMEKRKFKYIEDKSNKLRESTELKWFRNTLMVFEVF